MTKFNDYMPIDYEYPEPACVPMVGSDEGVSFSYVSETFLNGWINYVTVVSAYLVTRYGKYAGNVADLETWKKDPPFHADLSDAFSDDVHLLARAKDGAWWYFWFDRDCSDCMIGRFVTSDADDVVRANFDEYIRVRHGNEADPHTEGGDFGPALAIPVETIRGWMKG